MQLHLVQNDKRVLLYIKSITNIDSSNDFIKN